MGAKNGMGGFTLIEIMVAISMLAIVMTSIYGVFSSVSLAKQRLDDDSADFHLARVVFDRLGRELQGVYYREQDQTTLFIGGTNRAGEVFLQMTTTAVTPLSRTGTGIARVDYRLVKHAEDDDLVLMRSESDRRRIGATGEDSAMMRMAPGIAQMSFRFFANGQWLDELDARKNGLPELVQVSLIIGHDETRRIPFSTTYELPVVVLK